MGFSISKPFFIKRENIKNKIYIENKKDDWDLAHEKALELVKYRIKDYNFAKHGCKKIYMYQVYVEYKNECIPEHLRYQIDNE